MPAPSSTRRSSLRRLRVRLRQSLRSAGEVAAFVGAGGRAVFQLLTGRLPAPRRVKAPVTPESEPPPQCEHRSFAPYPLQD